MLDIKFIRENPNLVKENCRKRQIDLDVDRLLVVDAQRRKNVKQLEEIRAEKNKATKVISGTKDAAERAKQIAAMRKLDKKADEITKNFKSLDETLKNLLHQVPNILLDDVPEGNDSKDNAVMREWGTPPTFAFKPKDHIELGNALDIIDIARAAKVVGARFAYLKGAAVLLEFALVRYAFDVLGSESILKKIARSIRKDYPATPFVPVIPPIMIRPEVFRKMGRLTEEDKNERYYLPQDDLYLVGSAEHTLGPMHMDETIDEKKLPIRYVGFSTSLRREAGSYGRDTRGILRLHQFDKVEMESFTIPEHSQLEQEFFVAIQEYLMRQLKIPYRVVIMCAAETGRPDARQIDIEAWMPGQNRYRETHSADLMGDYQARRLNTRVKRVDGQREFIHMNDATGFAIGRTLIAILENYQQKDGSIKVPRVLQQYCGLKVIQ